MINRLASAIYNDIVGGLRGYHVNHSISLEQLEDDVVATRLAVIKEYSLKGILPIKDLLESINCISVDCKDLDRCKCNSKYTGTPQLHFTIPQVMADIFGSDCIDYIGSTDRQLPFIIYTSMRSVQIYTKYRRRAKNKPYVYLDTIPNDQGKVDGYIFNAPYLKEISVVAIFKDPRELENYKCCPTDEASKRFSFIDQEVRKRVTTQYIQYYRQMAPPIISNKQEYTAS